MRKIKKDRSGGMFERLSCGISGLLVRAGLCTVKLFAAIMVGIIKGAELIFSEIRDFLLLLKRAGAWLLRELTESLRQRHYKNKQLQKAVVKAKSDGRQAHITALARFAGSYLFGEGGICCTAFNYIAPLVSAAFLIGVIRYGSELEYGLSVKYNGKEIGVISSQSAFDQAEREVSQRTALITEREPVKLNADLSLKIISGSDRILNADQLANVMLETSDEELTEAYGIYIDGNFIGAVMDKTPVQDALDKRLLDFRVDGDVTDISYKNKVEYTKGLYLVSSVMEQQAAINKLTSSNKKRGVYVALTGDTAVTVSQKYNMELKDFEDLNPNAADGISPGQMVNITETESFLPIQYVLKTSAVSFLDSLYENSSCSNV